MCVIKHAFRFLIFCSLMLPSPELGCPASVAAAPCHCVDACTCVPNVGQFGYSTTQWRQWPSLPAGEPTASQPRFAPEESIRVPLTDEARKSNRPLAGPAIPWLTVPPPVEQDLVAPSPAYQPQEYRPTVPPPPSADRPVNRESTPATSPSDSDSGQFNVWREFPEQARTSASVRAIHEETRRPVEPHLGPVGMADQVSHYGSTQPWDEPRPWQEPARPTMKPSSRPLAYVPLARRELPPDLNGFCAVQLVDNGTWVAGDSRWAVEHRGRVYLMSGANQQQRFLANPGRYAPVLSGNDPVLAVDEGRQEPGRTDHCVVYDGRLYSFSSISTLTRFRQNPQRYAAIVEGTAY